MAPAHGGSAYRDNANEVMARIVRAQSQIVTAMQEGIVQGLRDFEAQYVQPAMRGTGPRSVSASGATKSSWRITRRGHGDSFRARLATNVWYLAAHQHAGRFDGHIYPKRKPYLMFRVVKSVQVFKKRGGGRLKRPKENRGWVRVKEVFIPKRLFILEDFKRYAPRLVWKHMSRAARTVMSQIRKGAQLV